MGVDLVLCISQVEAVQDGGLVQVCQAGQVRHAVQDHWIGWYQHIRLARYHLGTKMRQGSIKAPLSVFDMPMQDSGKRLCKPYQLHCECIGKIRDICTS